MTLVIVGCGAAKTPHPAPAGHLYTGSYHRACRRAADALTAHGGTVLILSALHGLTLLDAVIAPYELRMGQPGSITPAQLRDQAAALGVLDHRPVTVLAGAAYAAAALTVWPHATTPLSGLGIGRQLAHLKHLTHHPRECQ